MISSKECKKILEDNNIRMNEIKHNFVLSSRKSNLSLKFASFVELKKFVNFNEDFIKEFNKINIPSTTLSIQELFLAENNQRRFIYGNGMSIKFLPDYTHALLKITDNMSLMFSGEKKIYSFISLNCITILGLKKYKTENSIMEALKYGK
jgi:hypothetical protein